MCYLALSVVFKVFHENSYWQSSEFFPKHCSRKKFTLISDNLFLCLNCRMKSINNLHERWATSEWMHSTPPKITFEALTHFLRWAVKTSWIGNKYNKISCTFMLINVYLTCFYLSFASVYRCQSLLFKLLTKPSC